MKKIAIFASGSGSNAENIATYFASKESARVTLILTNRADAPVLQRASRLGIESVVFDRDTFYNSDKIIELLAAHGIDYIVLAGFLWLVPDNLLKAYPDRIVNIHPSLLPKHGGKGMYGDRVHRAVIESGDKESGITIHRVNELYDSGHSSQSTFEHKVQPYYSLRCVPQVIGPVYDTVMAAGKVLEDEFNSASDNPIVDPVSRNVYHGGNFHGDYISLEEDKVKTAVVRLAMTAERQLNYLFHDRINGILPPFLNLGVLGLNYGMQACQFTATSTTAECQTLAMPNYVHSIPNNNDNQDIVSMGTNSALICRRVIDNAWQVVSILYMALAQATDCLGCEDRLAPATRAEYRRIREMFPAFREDEPFYEKIAMVEDYLRNKTTDQYKTERL